MTRKLTDVESTKMKQLLLVAILCLLVGCNPNINHDFTVTDSEGNTITYSSRVTILQGSYAGRTGTVIENKGDGTLSIQLDNEGCSCAKCNCVTRPIFMWPSYLKVVEK